MCPPRDQALHQAQAAPAPQPTPAQREDRELVEAVLSGSEHAWRAFLDRYAGLIHAMILRYLPAADRDEVRSLYAEVLLALHRGKLRTYEGRAALSTWLTLVTRSEVLDHLRHRFGRREPPRALARMRPAERLIFK